MVCLRSLPGGNSDGTWAMSSVPTGRHSGLAHEIIPAGRDDAAVLWFPIRKTSHEVAGNPGAVDASSRSLLTDRFPGRTEIPVANLPFVGSQT